MQSAPTSKRLDLQGIRGLAIISVLGFHFFPSYFPNGYLGVDQFFVLSGFLMCMLLTKSKNLSFFSLLSEFYTKRFRRILPLFYFVILMAMIELNTVYPIPEITNNEMSASKAIMFMSNRERSENENYFKLLSVGTDLFLHTWSLSVEFQFYFIVPFIFVIGELFSSRLKYVYYLLLSALSLYFHCVSRPGIAFNNVFARIWQFLIGAGVYMVSGNMPSTNGYSLLDDVDCKQNQSSAETEQTFPYRNIIKYVCLFVSITVAFWPEELKSSGWRPLFTLITGVLMTVSIDDLFLSNRVLNYIGDISYALYLVHWPIFEYLSAWKMTNDNGILLLSLLVSVLLAAFLYHTFEKCYLSLSNTSVTILTVFLLTAIVGMIHIDEIKDTFFPIYRNVSRLDGMTEDMTIDDAESFNTLWNRRDLDGLMETGGTPRSPENDRWCDFPGKRGPYKIAIFGNSYARNHMKMVIQECKHKAYNITADAEKGCEPLSPRPETCTKSLDNFERFVESAQPDYAFLLTRFFSVGSPFTNNIPDVKNDTVYLKMRSQLNKFLPNIKKKLFILDAIPKIDQFYMPKIVKELKKGKTSEEINNKLVHDVEGTERARFRHAELVKECGEKCQLIDYYPLLFDKSTNQFRYFDKNGFSYFTIQLHLSPHGMELVRPLYTDICSKL